MIAKLASRLPSYDRISVGFSGNVDNGIICTAPNLGTKLWHGFALADALASRLLKPARIPNDADVQGLGVIDGRYLECVLALGTGIGWAPFVEGRLPPHLELGQHPIWKRQTYDQYLGGAALKEIGHHKWNRCLRQAIAIVETLVNFDQLHFGGGNAAAIRFASPGNAKIASNVGGITGGIKLWGEMLDGRFQRRASPRK